MTLGWLSPCPVLPQASLPPSLLFYSRWQSLWGRDTTTLSILRHLGFRSTDSQRNGRLCLKHGAVEALGGFLLPSGEGFSLTCSKPIFPGEQFSTKSKREGSVTKPPNSNTLLWPATLGQLLTSPSSVFWSTKQGVIIVPT